MFNLEKLIRANILALTPYSSARDEFKGEAKVFLDANENSFGSPAGASHNRYPDPMQKNLKDRLSAIKGVPAGNIFLGNGSDEVIDILFRVFCEPGRDNVIIVPPTYGMYEVSANINAVEVRKVPLTAEFQLNVEGISEAVDENTKLIFICSPNNPTGNSIDRDDVEFVFNNFNGIVAVDEAYINYSRQKSFIAELTEYPNLVVMQTLSKAWGLAGVRVGMLFASDEIIAVMNKVKPPYNIGTPAQELALNALNRIQEVNEWIRSTVSERDRLVRQLAQNLLIRKIYPSDANFLLVKVDEPKKVYNYLVDKGIIIRDRSGVTLCEGCLRITVGTPAENEMLITELNNYSKQFSFNQ